MCVRHIGPFEGGLPARGIALRPRRARISNARLRRLSAPCSAKTSKASASRSMAAATRTPSCSRAIPALSRCARSPRPVLRVLRRPERQRVELHAVHAERHAVGAGVECRCSPRVPVPPLFRLILPSPRGDVVLAGQRQVPIELHERLPARRREPHGPPFSPITSHHARDPARAAQINQNAQVNQSRKPTIPPHRQRRP